MGVPASSPGVATNYIADILQKQGLKARNGESFRYSSHSSAMNKVSDLLWRNFEACNKKCATDITYTPTSGSTCSGFTSQP